MTSFDTRRGPLALDNIPLPPADGRTSRSNLEALDPRNVDTRGGDPEFLNSDGDKMDIDEPDITKPNPKEFAASQKDKRKQDSMLEQGKTLLSRALPAEIINTYKTKSVLDSFQALWYNTKDQKALKTLGQINQHLAGKGHHQLEIKNIVGHFEMASRVLKDLQSASDQTKRDTAKKNLIDGVAIFFANLNSKGIDAWKLLPKEPRTALKGLMDSEEGKAAINAILNELQKPDESSLFLPETGKELPPNTKPIAAIEAPPEDTSTAVTNGVIATIGALPEDTSTATNGVLVATDVPMIGTESEVEAEQAEPTGLLGEADDYDNTKILDYDIIGYRKVGQGHQLLLKKPGSAEGSLAYELVPGGQFKDHLNYLKASDAKGFDVVNSYDFAKLNFAGLKYNVAGVATTQRLVGQERRSMPPTIVRLYFPAKFSFHWFTRSVLIRLHGNTSARNYINHYRKKAGQISLSQSGAEAGPFEEILGEVSPFRKGRAADDGLEGSESTDPRADDDHVDQNESYADESGFVVVEETDNNTMEKITEKEASLTKEKEKSQEKANDNANSNKAEIEKLKKQHATDRKDNEKRLTTLQSLLEQVMEKLK